MHPDHGTVEPYNSTVPFPESARYTCDDSYSITGDSTRTCQSHGGWDGSEPSCKEIGTVNSAIFVRFSIANCVKTHICEVKDINSSKHFDLKHILTSGLDCKFRY